MSNETNALSLSDNEQTDEKTTPAEGSTLQKIIFVDDDEEDLLLFDKAIKEINEGFELHYAINAERLFSLLQSITPDLIFLDLHLPGRSGITLLKTLRFHPEFDSIPIIIYSRLRNQSFINDCFNSKANYFIIKPVTFSKISRVISKVITIDWKNKMYPSREEFVIS